MSTEVTKKPTLDDVVSRNPGVNRARVAKYQEVVRQLHAYGIIDSPKYGIKPPLSGRGSIGQATHSSVSHNR